MSQWPSIVDSQGEKTNPTTTTVMADTGVVGTGVYDVTAVLAAAANAQVQIQHRNAANDGAASDAVVVYVLANDSRVVTLRFACTARSERFRVMMDGNLTGVGVASIEAHRVD